MDDLTIITFFGTFLGCALLTTLLSGLLGTLGLFVVVQERQALVYTLFGKIFGVISDPGPHCPVQKFGLQAMLVWLMGRCYTVDLRLDQDYQRSLPVNSEEGAPMGVGLWYEFWVSDPEAYLFRNTDPRGSMRANVSNSAVRVLSNLKLQELLEDRHTLSRVVRSEVAPKTHDWGYLLGSIYIRKVHFRDFGMMRQIEEKVTNRLRQVTATIQQDGVNQVNLISSNAERLAAVEFARASAISPEVVGAALQQITSSDSEVADAMFELLELKRMLGNPAAEVTLLPSGSTSSGLTTLLAARSGK
jgi:regulator of protease activity HflC (stomatin/prohibitin superfamily)